MGQFAKTRARRGIRSPVWVSGSDRCEDRTLLSGVAIYPQPAVTAVEKTETTAAPPADFSENWYIVSTEGDGFAYVTQNDNQVHVVLKYFFSSFVEVDGKVKKDTVKIKVNQVIDDLDIKGKIKATLDNPTEMSGKAKAKVAGLGKFTVPFTGTKVT